MKSISIFKNELFLLFSAIIFNILLLIYSVSNLSISYNEAIIYFQKTNFLTIVTNASTILFGRNDYALRLPFLILHFLNIFLIYKISKPILKRKSDRLISAILYMFLPGVLASAILINEAGFVIFITLLIIYFEQNKMFKSFIFTLLVSLIISEPFISLYISIIFFGIFKRDKKLAIFGLIFCLAWFWLNGIDAYGKPKGYFIDTIGVFAAVFSPLIFIYFIYTVYRIAIKEEKTFLWFVAITAFGICSIISIRQRPSLEMFLPFCVIFMPVMVRTFFSSYRARLPKFRIKYKFITIIVLTTLFLNSSATIFHNFLYIFLKDPKDHFAYKYDVAKELAQKLNELGISYVKTDQNLAVRLKFYGVLKGKEYILSRSKNDNCDQTTINIKKLGKQIDKFYLCKII
ncbi:ArnT family glycosyltransferase [Campylobacter fetus]|uniref:ArnT family glycosyltransferase n=1 Tax=Campylobacter fetus TaxID=196 RepID=UPI00163BB674|nr:glycosyltransferase family 39 protein [Campylobacter fetus]